LTGCFTILLSIQYGNVHRLGLSQNAKIVSGNLQGKRLAREQLLAQLDKYLHWYSEERIKISLGGMSPIEYRRTLGVCG